MGDTKSNKVYYLKKCKDNWKILVPEELVEDLIWECHTYYCHTGPKKCHQMLNEHFYVKKMIKRIKSLIKTCDLCQKCKSNNLTTAGKMKGITSTKPNQQLSIDIYGPLPTGRSGMKYLLVTIDTFSKLVQIYTMRRATSKTIIKWIFEDYIKKYGKPEIIQTDHGTQFISKAWVEKLKTENIKHYLSPVRRPHSNMVERVNKEIGRCLRTFCHDKHKAWVEYIPILNTYLNEIPHETTGYTPYELHFNIKPKRFWENHLKINQKQSEELGYNIKIELAANRIKDKAEKRADKHNKKYKITTFQPGDLVLVKENQYSDQLAGEISKFFKIYSGPYKVKKCLGDSTYKLVYYKNQNKVKGIFHATSLKIYNVPVKTPIIID